MTIITYRSGVMAADTAVWSGDTLVGHVHKIHRLDSGGLYGAAGNRSDALTVLKWLNGNRREPLVVTEDFGAIVAERDAMDVVRVYYLYRSGVLLEVDHPWYAEGSMREMAVGAMAAGACATEAAWICINNSSGAAGDVQTEQM